MPRISPPRGETKSQRIEVASYEKLKQLAELHHRNTVQEVSLIVENAWKKECGEKSR